MNSELIDSIIEAASILRTLDLSKAPKDDLDDCLREADVAIWEALELVESKCGQGN